MIVGYGLGSLGQGASYYFISSYFVVFLTNCVGFNAVLAGTISSVAMVVEVMAGMAVGNFSDRCRSNMGRRRPFMLVSSIVTLPVSVLLFTYVDLPSGLRVGYYIIFAVVLPQETLPPATPRSAIRGSRNRLSCQFETDTCYPKKILFQEK